MRVHVRPEDEDLAKQTLLKRFDRLTTLNNKGKGKGKGGFLGLGLEKTKNKNKNKDEEEEDKPIYNLDRITFHPSPTNHPWVRDTAPVYVLDKSQPDRRVAIDFGFCEWGGKNQGEIDVRHELPPSTIIGSGSGQGDDERYPVSRSGYASPDNRHWENARFAKRVLEHDIDHPIIAQTDQSQNRTGVERIVSPLRLEGGGLEVDGVGTLLATESSIICPHRNPSLSSTKEIIESHLRELLGVTKIIWFPGRKDLDITDCHVDGEVRFLEPGLVVLSKPHGKASKEEKEVYREIKDILERETDAQGNRFRIVELEAADPDKVGYDLDDEYWYEEEDVAGTYVNFYFVNGGLIVPVFGDKKRDRRAVEKLRGLISPERKIRQVYVSALPRMGGVVHCVTQQVL